MSGGRLEIKFRLSDGTDIGPKSFPAASSVATLKEAILSQWPKDKENGPRTVKEVKLISGGRVLDNNKKVGDCISPLGGGDFVPAGHGSGSRYGSGSGYRPGQGPGGATMTMHVLVQPSVKKGKKAAPHILGQNKCGCVIL